MYSSEKVLKSLKVEFLCPESLSTIFGNIYLKVQIMKLSKL